MNNSLKSILQVITVIILLAGVGFLGLKLTGLNQSNSLPNPDNQTTDLPGSSPTQLEVGENSEQATSEESISSPDLESLQCTSNNDCAIISQLKRSLAGKTSTTIDCLNKVYLEKCTNCSSSEKIIEFTQKNYTCTCVNNKFCELTPLSKP